MYFLLPHPGIDILKRVFYTRCIPASKTHTLMKYHVERSIHINAPKETVKPFIEDFNHWNSWSPWTIAEPGCPVEVKGNPGGSGHSMSWDGQIIGSGINTLVANNGNSLNYDLVFLKPFKSQAKTAFHMKEKDGGTLVTWTMDSKMPFFLFFMVPTMKTMIGMDYDRGLRMLKEIVEKGHINASTTNEGMVHIEGFSYVGIERTVSIDDIGPAMEKDFNTLVEDLVHKHDLNPDQWVSVYTKMDMKNRKMTYIAAVSDEGLNDATPASQFVRGTVKPSKALEVKHDGPYDFIGNAWTMGSMYLRAKKIKNSASPYEKYWNSPKEVSPEELKTSIYFPVKG